MFQVRALWLTGSLKGEVAVLRYTSLDAAMQVIDAVNADADMRMVEFRTIENGQMTRVLF